MALDVKQPKSYRKAWNGSPRKHSVVELIDMLNAHLHRSLMGYSERFEADAERFYRETGYMAPGKSVPMAMAGSFRDDDRVAAWQEWCRLERDDYHMLVREAIAVLESHPAADAVARDSESPQG